MVSSTLSLQALGGVPKKWEREINYRPARRKGKRIAEKRIRLSARGEIDSQLADMGGDPPLTRHEARQQAVERLQEIEGAYYAAVAVAREARNAAIEALPPNVRGFIKMYFDEEYPVRRYYVE